MQLFLRSVAVKTNTLFGCLKLEKRLHIKQLHRPILERDCDDAHNHCEHEVY